MQLLCIAALLLSAVAAQSGSRRPWQEGQFLTTSEPKLDADSKSVDDEQSVTHAPEDGQEGLGGGWPAWDSDHRSQVSASGKRQTVFISDGSESHHPRPARQSGGSRGRGPSRGQRPNRRNPGAKVFSPVFKVDNVTFQNITDVTLKEGENIFLMPRHGGRGAHNHKGGRHGPPKDVQVVKLIYNATEPNKVSVEFGLFKPKLGEFIGEENNDEDY
ncbi:uncharacterized protein LOC117735380 [Cyclopterus lumpus]|uniref:uncharacterized protein LOC117735380 n=1 Tax=Cyclopterus lumpus TaxID=8103 RepID=UPI0014862C0F|nr:uncharacterized protein LOC117735380 [Cyclopterus lumpus]